MHKNYDILVVGAGFGGSLTALISHNLGLKVCLVEKGQHPRFALGESSTPIADMVLRDISKTHNLPWLHDFSRYGTWQSAHPKVVCGLKRGFSYYKHYPNQVFHTDQNHANELLVAASSNDTLSDTNWLRADFDRFLVEKVKEYEIDYFDLTDILDAQRENGKWSVQFQKKSQSQSIHTQFIIDASGGSELIKRLFGVASSAEGFKTHSFAVYSHFENLPEWSGTLASKGISLEGYPYDPDHSALHHVFDEAWAWSLRFNNSLTSFGFMVDGRQEHLNRFTKHKLAEHFSNKYPDIGQILKYARYAQKPGGLLSSDRLQRKAETCFGDGWVALPHTAGFVDPMFSTGIAQTLTGIERLTDILGRHFGNPTSLSQNLRHYEKAVFKELELIDILVSGCYHSFRQFPLFISWTMLYFAVTIKYEQSRLNQQAPGYLLCAEDPDVHLMIRETYRELLKLTKENTVSESAILDFTELVRKRIQPMNTAGLLNPSAKNMYWHTVAEL